jgi:heme/copper-type cytochrome/quinol oxidase subunit 2
MPRKEPDMTRLIVWTMPVAAVLCLLTSALAQAPTEPGSGGAQVIEVTAKKYVFEPSPIHVKAGTRVQLKITAIDHAHGFQIERVPEGADKKSAPGLVFANGPECYKIEKHQTETVEFVAQTAGTYRFKCCTDCGFHHRSMKGELIVDP